MDTKQRTDIEKWLDRNGGQARLVDLIVEGKRRVAKCRDDVKPESIRRHLRRAVKAGYLPSEYWLVSQEFASEGDEPCGNWHRLVPGVALAEDGRAA